MGTIKLPKLTRTSPEKVENVPGFPLQLVDLTCYLRSTVDRLSLRIKGVVDRGDLVEQAWFLMPKLKGIYHTGMGRFQDFLTTSLYWHLAQWLKTVADLDEAVFERAKAGFASLPLWEKLAYSLENDYPDPAPAGEPSTDSEEIRNAENKPFVNKFVRGDLRESVESREKKAREVLLEIGPDVIYSDYRLANLKSFVCQQTYERLRKEIYLPKAAPDGPPTEKGLSAKSEVALSLIQVMGKGVSWRRYIARAGATSVSQPTFYKLYRIAFPSPAESVQAPANPFVSNASVGPAAPPEPELDDRDDLQVTVDNPERSRMIFDLPADVQMAIKIKAVKSGMTTGEVVCEAFGQVFGNYLEEARLALSEQQKTNVNLKK